MELSGAAIPSELSELWTDYKKSQEADGKKVKGGGGFSGKGFKFDVTEAQLVNEKKKFQKHALGTGNILTPTKTTFSVGMLSFFFKSFRSTRLG